MEINNLREPNMGDRIRVVCPGGYAPLYDANGKQLTKTIADGTELKVFAVKEINNKIYYRISGQDEWIPKNFTNWGQQEPLSPISKEPVKETKKSKKSTLKLCIIAALIIIAVGGGIYSLTQFHSEEAVRKSSKVKKAKKQSSTVSKTKKYTKADKKVKEKTKDKAKSRFKATTKNNSKKKTQTKINKLAWNTKKEQELAKYMVTFGKIMRQKYTEYDGNGILRTNAGQEYPTIFQKTKFLLNGTKVINIGWDPQLKQNYDYHVVSIFNYNRGSVEFHITYLFCIHSGQPIVLCDQTTNGNDVAVTITKNEILRDNFAKIARG